MNESGARGGAFLAAGAASAVSNGGSPSRSSESGFPTGGAGLGGSFDPYADQEELLFAEQYPGKLCALCNLSERSALGQGEMVKYKLAANFDLNAEVEERRKKNNNSSPAEGSENNGDGSVAGRSPKNSGSNSMNNSLNARRKGRKFTSGDVTEPVDELENVGFSEEPDHNLLFESTGKH